MILRITVVVIQSRALLGPYRPVPDTRIWVRWDKGKLMKMKRRESMFAIAGAACSFFTRASTPAFTVDTRSVSRVRVAG